MVCDLKIRELERRLGRKLTEAEKKKVREKMGHVEIPEENEKEEMEVFA